MIVCILGLMQLFGWEMGVIESVSITVLVGLSVDYVVHLANSYIECTKTGRCVPRTNCLSTTQPIVLARGM